MSYYLIGIGGTGARCMEAFVGYYLNSLFNSAEAVKFIPPLGERLHG